MAGFTYILTNRRNGTLYIGATTDLVRRIWEHRNAEVPGFTRRYGLRRLVHFEAFDDFQDAFRREKTMKAWRRVWKIELIEANNPEWRDLWDEIARP